MSQITAITSGGGGSGDVKTLTGNSGGAIGATAGNINVIGSGSVSVSGSGSTLTISNSGSSGGTISTIFTNSGTWTKNSNTKYVNVFIWDGGAGGGSGRQSSSGNAGGGGGGAPGGTAYFYGPQLFFPSSLSVTVGAGGNGASQQTNSDSDGFTGSPWGSSQFGSMSSYLPFSFLSASPGDGGTIGSSPGGAYQGNLTTYNAIVEANPSPTSGSGELMNGNSASAIYATSLMSATAGGGGAGADTGNIWTGGSGGNIEDVRGPSILYVGGQGGSESIFIDGFSGTNQGVIGSGYISGGTGGGGGGGQSSGSVAGNGGMGGFPGGGGGGGGGSLNGTFSGQGGNGANGQVIVIEFT